MSRKIIEQLPAFTENEYVPFKMRQLTSILDRRLQSLEQSSGSSSVTGDLTELDARYAYKIHTHTKAEITDFGNPLYSLGAQSVFSLLDVSQSAGGVNVNDTLIWDGSKFITGPSGVGGGNNTLAGLYDTTVTGLTDLDGLVYNAATQRWVATRKASTPWIYRGGDTMSGDLKFSDYKILYFGDTRHSSISYTPLDDTTFNIGRVGVDGGKFRLLHWYSSTSSTIIEYDQLFSAAPIEGRLLLSSVGASGESNIALYPWGSMDFVSPLTTDPLAGNGQVGTIDFYNAGLYLTASIGFGYYQPLENHFYIENWVSGGEVRVGATDGVNNYSKLRVGDGYVRIPAIDYTTGDLIGGVEFTQVITNPLDGSTSTIGMWETENKYYGWRIAQEGAPDITGDLAIYRHSNDPVGTYVLRVPRDDGIVDFASRPTWGGGISMAVVPTLAWVYNANISTGLTNREGLRFSVSNAADGQTGGSIFFVENDLLTYGFQHVYDGSANTYYFKAHEASSSGTNVYSVDRTTAVLNFNTVPQRGGVALLQRNVDEAVTGLWNFQSALSLGSDVTPTSTVALQVAALGMFTSAGDAQTMLSTLRRITNDATPAVLTTNGASPSGTANVLAIPANCSWLVRIFLAGRDTATQDSFTAVLSGMIDRGASAASTTATAFAQETLGADQPWSVAVDADTTGGALRVTVTGEAAKTIRWMARVEITQVRY